jgi:dUTP pyrophosphatase
MKRDRESIPRAGHPVISVPVHSESGILPAYETSLASGCDLRALIEKPVKLESLERALIPTGLRVEIPPGYEGQVRPRSGKAVKKGLSLPNTPGTIDADYRGEIKVAVINLDREPIFIEPGEKIAQLVFAPVFQSEFVMVESPHQLNSTDRQEGGFGSTGH